jgi:hypothetical protein
VRNPVRFTKVRSNQLWLGDYIGVTAKGPAVYGVFADNISGASHVRFFAGQ